ncbi:MAG: flavin reductase family protein [Aigarchaeota archaeon]|nr:flavin reductase family protein [Aigarchaeota archaeon]MDW8092982.1 flavin reductase family protein [Nitrososphaerota archaeon]
MDQEVKRRVLRLLTYGLYVLTTRHGDEISASTVNWVSQASFTPPLLMLAIKRGSRTHELIERSNTFVLNILGSDQKDVAQSFFKETTVEGNRINGLPFEPGPITGAPVLTELPAWVECKVRSAVKDGDHTVFVAEVVEVGLRRPNAKPLVMWDTGWFYGG